jgi:hypothetical protein
VIVEELRLNSTPCGAGGGVLGRDRLGEVVADGVEDPRLDNAIHKCPVRESSAGTSCRTWS